MQALQQLEQDIGDVNQIFAELARIVHEQGDVVDSIEANVENAQIHVEQVGIFSCSFNLLVPLNVLSSGIEYYSNYESV